MIQFTIVSFTIGCLLLSLPPSAWSKEMKAAGPVLTLDQAVDLALENNRPLKTATLEVEKSGEATDAIRTQRLPALNLFGISGQRLTESTFSFKQGAFGSFPGVGPVPGTNTEIKEPIRWSTFLLATAVQPLTPLLRINESIRLSEVTQEVVQEQRRDQRHVVVNKVKRAYFEALQVQSGLEATDETIKFLQELDRMVAEEVTRGRALRTDSLEVKTRLAEATHRAVTLDSALATQKEQLNDLLGRDVQSEFSLAPVSSIPGTLADPRAAVKEAMERRPLLKATRLRVQQAEHDARFKELQYIPDLSVIALHLQGINIGQVLPEKVSIAGLLLSWEVFDWGRKQRELGEKRRAVEQTRIGVLEAEAQVAVEVRHLLRNLQDAESLVPVKKLTLEAATDRLRVTMSRYSQKAAVLQDVFQAQSAVADANHQLQDALLGFLTAKADFEKAIGEE